MGRTKGSVNKVKLEINTGDSMSEVQVLDSLETEIDKVRLELEKTKKELEDKKSELYKLPVRELDAKEKEIQDKQISGFSKNAGLKEKIEKQKQYDNQMITGKFINRRAPGQEVKLTYMKYADDPVKWYPLKDGKVYTIPRGFVDQINDYYHTPHFVQKEDEMDSNRPSSAIHEVDTSNKKYAFVPVSF